MLHFLIFNQWAAVVFYGLLAVGALLATWGTYGKRKVGVTFAVCWLITMFLWFNFPTGWQPAMFPFLDGAIAFAAFLSIKDTGDRLVPITLIALSTLAASASVAVTMALLAVGIRAAVSFLPYIITINMIFIAQAVVTVSWGVADVLGRAHGIGIGSPVLRRHAQHRGNFQNGSER